MQITKISKQKNRSDRYNVYIDGDYSFSLSATDLLETGIAKGDEVTRSALKKYKRVSAKSLLKDHAISYQVSRPHSEFETVLYLRKKILKNPELKAFSRDIRDKLISEIIDYLSARDIINDKKFAMWLVKQRTESQRPRSKRAIVSELRQKRVSPQITQEVTQTLSEDLEIENAKIIASKKANTLNRYTYKQKRQKLIAYLQTKGFNWRVISQVVDSFYPRN